MGFQCLDLTPSSPDLALSDYHLLPGLRQQLKCRHFSCGAEAIFALETWLDGKSSDFFECLKQLDQQAKSSVQLRGDCVE